MKYLLCACLLLFCLIIGATNMPDKHSSSDYVDMANKITAEVSAKLTKRYHMNVFGEVSGMADSVNIVGVHFILRGPLSRDQIRIILVDCVEEFLSVINSNEEIRPFLKEYPFTAQGIDIAIFIEDSKGGEVYDPDIAVGAASYGRVWYATKDKSMECGYKNKFEEDYQTALKIVRDRAKK